VIQGITVLYDERCGFCCRSARWLSTQPRLMHLECIARGHPAVYDLFPGLPPRSRAELTVVDDEGGVYVGDDAWLVTMWALLDWRLWSYRLARPALRPFAHVIFSLLSVLRHGVNALAGLEGETMPVCEGDACRREVNA
jgi:predicted DCC family thiol-disulfide oxidoreductase YuxK